MNLFTPWIMMLIMMIITIWIKVHFNATALHYPNELHAECWKLSTFFILFVCSPAWSRLASRPTTDWLVTVNNCCGCNKYKPIFIIISTKKFYRYVLYVLCASAVGDVPGCRKYYAVQIFSLTLSTIANFAEMYTVHCWYNNYYTTKYVKMIGYCFDS